MSITQLLTSTQFLVDAAGTRKSVVLDYHLWEELLEILEDVEDDDEIRQLRKTDKEADHGLAAIHSL